MSMTIMINCNRGEYLLVRPCLLSVVIYVVSFLCLLFSQLAIEGSYLLEVGHI